MSRFLQPEKQAQAATIHYISNHYTPTAHLRPAGSDVVSEPSRSPPPPYNEAVMPDAMEEVLRQHSVDPSALLPNQVHLFLNADDEQRLRLLELWRIAPPSYPLEEHLNQGTWVSTSMEREEAERYPWETHCRSSLPASMAVGSKETKLGRDENKIRFRE